MTTEEYRTDIDISWILRAVHSIQYGKVILVLHDRQLVRVDTKERKAVTK